MFSQLNEHGHKGLVAMPMDVIVAVRIRKARCVKRFFDHLRTLGVVATNSVPTSLPATRKQRSTCVKPFIFSTEQVAAILSAAGRLPDSTRFPHRAQTLATECGNTQTVKSMVALDTKLAQALPYSALPPLQ